MANRMKRIARETSRGHIHGVWSLPGVLDSFIEEVIYVFPVWH
jgi:hypothetical protein